MLDKKGMFLIDAMMALMIVGVITSILILALSMYIKSSEREEESIHVEEFYQEASRLHDD